MKLVSVALGLAGLYSVSAWARQEPLRGRGDGAPVQALPAELRVQLVGFADGTAGEYQVGQPHLPLRVPFDREGGAMLPWDSDGLNPLLEVSAPGGLEVVATFPTPTSEAEPLRLRVGGGEAVEVLVVGELDPESDLFVALEYKPAFGRRARVSQPAVLGEPASFAVGEPGDVWVDVCSGRGSYEQILGRGHVVVDAGRPSAVTVDIGKRRTYATFEAGKGQRVTEGYFMLTVAGESGSVAIGRDLDAEDRVLVAARDQRDLLVVGASGSREEPIVAADVPVSFDTRAGGEVKLVLGELVESQVELIDAATGAPLDGWSFDVAGAATGLSGATFVTGREGEPARVRWYGRSTPAVELHHSFVWSPRELVPLRPGPQRITVMARAYPTFVAAGELSADSTPGLELADLRHLATGLDKAALGAQPGVAHELVPEGHRFRGIPAGAYLVRLAGEEVWRGPIDVPGVYPSRVAVGGN